MKKLIRSLLPILFFAFLFFHPIYAAPTQGISDWTECTVDGIPTLSCLEVITGNLLTMSSVIVVLILFIMFVIGSISYLTSGGDPEKVHKAQQTLMYALIGTVLFVSAFLIIKIIDTLFLGGKGQLFNFSIDTNPQTP